MSATELTAAVRQDLAELTAPLHAQMKKLDEAVALVTAELDELRATRSSLKKTLALLDPSSVPAKKAKQNGGSLHISQEKIDQVARWLRARADDKSIADGFTGTTIERDANFPIAQSTAGKVLTVLHDQGVIRLDRRGRGGAKIFKLVS